MARVNTRERSVHFHAPVATQRKADKAELARVHKIVAILRREGMSPHDVAAALRTARRMRDTEHSDLRPLHRMANGRVPITARTAQPTIIGRVLLEPVLAELRPADVGLGDLATLIFDVERGDGDV